MQIKELMIPAEPLRQGDIDGGKTNPAALAPASLYPVIDGDGMCIGVIAASSLRFLYEHSVRCAPYLDADIVRLPPETEIADLPMTGAPILVQSKAGDILGIITAERLLAASQDVAKAERKRFLAIITSARNGIIVVDDKGRIMIANQPAAQLLSADQGAMIGKKINEISSNTRIFDVIENKKPVICQKIVAKESTVFATYSPIFIDDKFFGVVSIFNDISSLSGVYRELDQVKALLKEQEGIIESSYDGLSITDGNGVVLCVNRAYQEMTGVTSAEIVGKTMAQMIEAGIYDQSVSELVRQDRMPVTINQDIKGRNFLVTGNPVFDEKGDICRIVNNLRDVTELTKLRDELELSRKQAQTYKKKLKCLRNQYFNADDGIVFRSPAMEQILFVAAKVSGVDSNVLITGESGTGKELIAKLIHERGKGPARPFIKINCAALPENLLESELFGYEAGSFTGARKGGKPGMFELAQGGTLFLDEIGDMPQSLQVKLLRALQEKEIMRLGGTKTISVDIRIIAATNQNLEDLLQRGLFREDLYYRLMVVPIRLPPLRERREDIPALIAHFLKKFNEKMSVRKRINFDAMDVMLNYKWTGNIRELENVVERMVVVSDTDCMTLDHLPEIMRRKSSVSKNRSLQDAVENLEISILKDSFRDHGSWKTVAEKLGVNLATVYRKVRRYGLVE